ncbi:acetyl-CoA carboxylase biotin carboxylase subunit [Virgibacillus alimentarius]|uniref:biotin carboxylase n=1 Tax=Virgibacillus alimentarius TaxID=698769 RepID=A0ABS4SA24_9BACI|nr:MULTISPECIES: acetyl-CoA carboxylase biotin carboxylase subunit [Virgibacillus]MBP2258359.1 acetyl-CoA carboxylase biotin carboxylase subunit [Virgibacillus alimentarius]HLR67945.1 acetyl-CoA carboxylase biotin carboxylase subunit [Virgibacillus sp.]
MINKLLVANRGEIAARIIRTCKENDIKTVAIYSEADARSLFVKMADESYLIGPPRVSESYLNTDKVLEIAKQTKVDAVHPGYGFLSENGSFADKCEQAGITFIGPSSNVIEQMGDKISARKLMEKAGVPVIPGTKGEVSDAEAAIKEAEHIGYPIMVKASAGGGGIGMQIVHTAQELLKAFESNSQRAEQFFGDGSMFMEKLLVNSRHIEVQVLADTHGNAIHLFERECSIQRRNQKVVEEAPSSFISKETRKKMGEAAIKAVKEIGYTNAGTIEFLVDENEQFYFLEMNTRIQVEHAITEEITGLDIVKMQIDIANGEKLRLDQNDLEIQGHSIEVRIYAEDPVTFFPSPGEITVYEEPAAKYIRVESSIEQGSKITPFYDPMISKLIATGNNRNEAISRLNDALQNYKIEGIKTNIPMLKEVIHHEHFISGNTTTDFVEEHYLPIVK